MKVQEARHMDSEPSPEFLPDMASRWHSLCSKRVLCKLHYKKQKNSSSALIERRRRRRALLSSPVAPSGHSGEEMSPGWILVPKASDVMHSAASTGPCPWGLPLSELLQYSSSSHPHWCTLGWERPEQDSYPLTFPCCDTPGLSIYKLEITCVIFWSAILSNSEWT